MKIYFRLYNVKYIFYIKITFIFINYNLSCILTIKNIFFIFKLYILKNVFQKYIINYVNIFLKCLIQNTN